MDVDPLSSSTAFTIDVVKKVMESKTVKDVLNGSLVKVKELRVAELRAKEGGGGKKKKNGKNRAGKEEEKVSRATRFANA